MKKGIIFTFIACYIFISNSNGQIKEKSIVIGGDISFNSDTYFLNNTTASKSFLLNASIGKAFKVNSVWGVNLLFAPSNVDITDSINQSNSKVKINQYGLGVFNNRYKKIANDLYLFIGTNILFGYSNEKHLIGNNILTYTTKSYEGSISLNPGITYRFYKKFYAEIVVPQIFSIDYQWHNNSAQNNGINDSVLKEFSIKSSLSKSLTSLQLGFRIII